MGNVIDWLYLLIGVGGVVDAALHPESDWAHADRNKVFWILFMFVFSVFFVLPYLIIVRPRFAGANDNAFLK